MKKSFWVVLIVLIFICMGALVLKAEAPKKEVPEKFEINSDAKHFTNAKKSKNAPKYKLVTLSHKKHSDLYEGNCMVCHHELKDNPEKKPEDAQKCSTDGCHSAKAKDKCADLKTAMHNQCYKGCHKTDEKAKLKNAPTKCADRCHVKAESGGNDEKDE